MALKAGEGRYGLTKKMFLAVKNLSVMEVIKSFGDGLVLSDSGVASVDIDTDTMEFTETGKLASKSTGSGVKKLTYTGDGNTTSTIDFGSLDSLPEIILAISGSSTNGYDVSTCPIPYGVCCANTYWAQREGTSKSSELQKVTYSDNNTKMHITGTSADTSLNTNGVTWTVYYL